MTFGRVNLAFKYIYFCFVNRKEDDIKINSTTGYTIVACTTFDVRRL